MIFLDEKLAIDAPACPTRALHWSCDDSGLVDSLALDREAPAGKTFHISYKSSALFSPRLNPSPHHFFGPPNGLPACHSIDVRNVTLTNWQDGDAIVFPLFGEHLTMANVYAPDVSFMESDRAFNSCTFVDVLLRCPIPAFLLPCFNTSNPPCLMQSSAPLYLQVSALHRCIDDAICAISCSPPPADGFGCDRQFAAPYFPSVRGYATVEIVFSGRAWATSVAVVGSGVVGLVNRLELWDWTTMTWVTVHDVSAPKRQDSSANEVFIFPPLLTNRARLALEQWEAGQRGAKRSLGARNVAEKGHPQTGAARLRTSDVDQRPQHAR